MLGFPILYLESRRLVMFQLSGFYCIYLTNYLFFVSLSLSLHLLLSFSLSINLSVYLSIDFSVHPPVYLSIHLSVVVFSLFSNHSYTSVYVRVRVFA